MIKPIRPTVIEFKTQEELDEFVDWATRKPTEADKERVKDIKELLKNHVRSEQRKS
jgi:hypothetical protein